MTDVKLPPLSADLVSALDELFPERCPDIHASDREIWVEVGKREVVRFIQHQFKVQQEAARSLGHDGGELPMSAIIPKP